jgi:hypothetical protein
MMMFVETAWSEFKHHSMPARPPRVTRLRAVVIDWGDSDGDVDHLPVVRLMPGVT